MTQNKTKSTFKAELIRPAGLSDGELWAYVILPIKASDKLPRRGRTTVEGTVNGFDFQQMLEPDGKLSHWLKISKDLLDTANLQFGDKATFVVQSVEQEPEPDVPDDFQKALTAAPEAQANWDATTTIARLDWIHWLTSAKQSKTRLKRINDACDMLAAGKRRVCCFDPSGFYSKALSAPKAEK